MPLLETTVRDDTLAVIVDYFWESADPDVGEYGEGVVIETIKDKAGCHVDLTDDEVERLAARLTRELQR
jgi:hypothetical protein